MKFSKCCENCFDYEAKGRSEAKSEIVRKLREHADWHDNQGPSDGGGIFREAADFIEKLVLP